jgi:hypothetical protein
MVLCLFQFNPVPLNFNPNNKVSVYNSSYKAEYQVLEQKLDALSEDKKVNLLYIDQLIKIMTILFYEKNCPYRQRKDLRDSAKEIILKADSGSETNDKDYVFFHFKLPAQRTYRLLLAVIISAAMSSTASGLNALASTTAIDIYKRNLKERRNQKALSQRDKVYLWGVVAIFFVSVGTLFEKPNPTENTSVKSRTI